jgi:perosamine synthetase
VSADRHFVPLHRPDLGEGECEAVARVIRSGWVSQGSEVEAFEREFAAFVGASHAVAVSSGTTALELALRASGIGPGDEVIAVSHSSVATANAIRSVGARPVFVDVLPDMLTIDPAQIEIGLGPATRALMVVHQVGMPCDMSAVMAVARRRRLRVIEDAACAIGSEICLAERWERIGRPHGDIACFSFHARKPITTGEGGMITTRDDDIAAFLRRLRNHGMSIPAEVRHASERVIFEDYETHGYNARLSDIAAAVGRVQLQRLPDIVARRRALARRYAVLLAAEAVAKPLVEPEWARSNWQSYPVRLRDGVDQQQVMQFMLDEGIATRRGIMCAHLEPAWPRDAWICAFHREACPGGSCSSLVQSEKGRDHHILLPLYPSMTEVDLDRVVASLVRACR